MIKFTNEDKALTLLKRLIEQAETEIAHLERYKKINAGNMLITTGKILVISARLDEDLE